MCLDSMCPNCDSVAIPQRTSTFDLCLRPSATRFGSSCALCLASPTVLRPRYLCTAVVRLDRIIAGWGRGYEYLKYALLDQQEQHKQRVQLQGYQEDNTALPLTMYFRKGDLDKTFDKAQKHSLEQQSAVIEQIVEYMLGRVNNQYKSIISNINDDNGLMKLIDTALSPRKFTDTTKVRINGHSLAALELGGALSMCDGMVEMPILLVAYLAERLGEKEDSPEAKPYAQTADWLLKLQTTASELEFVQGASLWHSTRAFAYAESSNQIGKEGVSYFKARGGPEMSNVAQEMAEQILLMPSSSGFKSYNLTGDQSTAEALNSASPGDIVRDLYGNAKAIDFFVWAKDKRYAKGLSVDCLAVPDLRTGPETGSEIGTAATENRNHPHRPDNVATKIGKWGEQHVKVPVFMEYFSGFATLLGAAEVRAIGLQLCRSLRLEPS